MDYLKVRESPYRGKTNIAPHQFYSECVRLSRPCVFTGMANEQRAMKKWNTFDDGYDYFKTFLTEDVNVYIDVDNYSDRHKVDEWNSFSEKFKNSMPYHEFYEKVTKTRGVDIAIKDYNMYKQLRNDLEEP